MKRKRLLTTGCMPGMRFLRLPWPLTTYLYNLVIDELQLSGNIAPNIFIIISWARVVELAHVWFYSSEDPRIRQRIKSLTADGHDFTANSTNARNRILRGSLQYSVSILNQNRFRLEVFGVKLITFSGPSITMPLFFWTCRLLCILQWTKFFSSSFAKKMSLLKLPSPILFLPPGMSEPL